jgi:hypothetical protein
MATAVSILQTTPVRIPKRLYEEARSVVETGASEARSLNDLLVDSLSQKLKQLRRERIDAEFAGMKNDGESQRQAEAMADEFAYSDWEALRSAEKRAK